MTLNHAEARTRAESYYDEQFAEVEGKLDIAVARVNELKAALEAAQAEGRARDAAIVEFTRSLTDAQAEVARLKARIAELEAPVPGPEPVPTPEPVPDPQPTPPSVTILTPAPGTSFDTSTVYISAAVAGLDAPTVVLLYQDSVVATLGKAGSLYETTIKTAGVPDGQVVFSVRATSGATSVTASSTVTKGTATPAPTPEPTPEPTPPPVVTLPVPAGGRFGVFWPSNTPRPGQVPSVIVDCTWSAIRQAILAGARHLRVRDGALNGAGAGSSRAGELAGLNGLNSAGQNVLITPLNGYGRVKLDSGISFVEIQGISFVGFEAIGQAVLFRNSHKSAWAWSEINMCRVTANDSKSASDIEWIEPVSRGLLIASDDRHRFVTAKPGTTLSGIGIYGGYGAPILKPVGSSAHCDHLQVERQDGGGEISGISIEKHVMYGAHSQTLMFAGIPGVRLKDAVLLGGPYFEHRYARPDTTTPKVYEPRVLAGAAEAYLEGENVFLGTVSTGWTFTGPGTRKTFNSPAEAYAWLDSKHPEPTQDELKKSWIF